MDEYELILGDRTRVPLRGTVTIGRGADSTVRLADPSVSRRHAAITVDGAGLTLRDVGSSHGTRVDGTLVVAPTALRDGSRIRLGDQALVVERRRADDEAGRTIVVPQRAAETVRADGRPRLRSGHAIKRLEASEAPYRWVLRDLRSGRFLRLGDADGRLLELLDGRASVLELMASAEERLGPDGPPRLARLLTELADRGFLDDAADEGDEALVPRAGLRRLLAPREWELPEAAARFTQLYQAGGWRLLTPTALHALAAVALAGIVAFAYLVVGRYGTPFVVASKVGLGGAVFAAGRLAVAAVHECAHGLTMASFGRRIDRAGLKVVLIFPYAFVDTSEAWLEPRRRRIAISSAGPVADAVVGAVFALSCLALGPGPLRDVCFQLAFGAYLGALVNLNPLVERDGYHILTDVLREPSLRRRARAELGRRIRGEAVGAPSPVLLRYAAFGLVWSLVAAVLLIAGSLRYAPAARGVLPEPVVAGGLALMWLAVLLPVLLAVGGPLRDRVRRRRETG
jgi:putative peptide zinc metalloprotease protein